jgi:hypothetical protein
MVGRLVEKGTTMANSARALYSQEVMRKLYPAYSRRATQVCILSSAMEKIASGCDDPQRVACEALDAADPFDWKSRKTRTKK